MPATVVTPCDKERLRLGRAEDCDVVLRGSLTSRYHAELVQEGRFWVISDSCSRNGVHVNGRRVQREALSQGDVLRLGDWVGVVRHLAEDCLENHGPLRELAPGLLAGVTLAEKVAQVPHLARTIRRFVVEGETGTGKECLARAIHEWSGRKGKFVGVNCAALPEHLAESELFGCTRGAFTGADRARHGYLRTAHGGTLLLDEITDLPLSIQAKLLRALEENAVTPLGESEPINVDTLVIAASQVPLKQAVERKRFRADLCARLAGATVVLPPLRERSEDVPELFAHMLASYCSRVPPVDVRLIEALCSYPWPFNVREVDQLARRIASLHADEPLLTRSHLPAEIRVREAPGQFTMSAREHFGAPATEARDESPPAWPEDDAEKKLAQKRQALRKALSVHGGNLTHAAQSLGITRQKAYRLMSSLSQADLDELRNGHEPNCSGGRRRNPNERN